MRSVRFWALVGLLLAPAACAEEPVEEMAAEMEAEPEVDAGQSLAVDTVEAVVPEAAGMSMTANLQPVGNSGVSGRAALTGSGPQTQVAVRLNGLSPGAHAGHIHRGTCANIGPPVVPLPEITAGADGAGTANASVQISTDALMAGPYLVAYHQGGAGNPGPPVVCGEVGH